jgi:hypothetical protein
MSLKSTLLVATALFGYFGLASAQNAPLVLSKQPAKDVAMPAPQLQAQAPSAPAKAPAAARPEQGLKLARPQPAETRGQAPGQSTVDESALRFYASQADTARVAAEIRRLKTLHPTWQPPENLFASGPQVDEQRLWDLFALGRYDDVVEQIQALRAEFPGYNPSPDLTTKLGQAQRRGLFVAASEQRDWEQVVALAAENQDLLVCREIDILWRVAEAFASLDDKDQALEVYRYVLANCDNPKERLATVQKASAVMPIQAIEQLVAAGKRRKEGGTEFDVVRLDLIRRNIGAIASGQSAQTPSDREIKLIEASARGRNADDAGLLGWYAFQAKDFNAAYDWFKLARDNSKDPKHIEGMILALRNRGQIAEAQTLAYANRAAGPLIRKAYIEIVATEATKPNAPALAPEPLKAFEEAIETEKSALGAQALGWHLFLQNNYKAARTMFEKSSGWGETQESVLGQALSLQRLGEKKAYSEFLTAHQEKYPALAKLAAADKIRLASPGRGRGRGGDGNSGLIKQAVNLYESGNYQAAAALMDRNQARLNPGMNALRGWAHFKSNNFGEAEQIFKKYGHVKGSEQGEFLSYIFGRSVASKWYQ